jgi:hypothetical protein
MLSHTANKYLRHLTPLAFEGWERHIAGDLVAVCRNPELPAEFRDEIRGELLQMKEEIERAIITSEREEW